MVALQGLKQKNKMSFYGAAYEFIKEKKIDSIRLSTRPDYIDRETLKRLKKYKVKTIELGVQSANDFILERAGRGHTFADVKRASKLIRWYGFTLGHQMMIGLPESTWQDEIETAKKLIKLKPKMVRIYPVLVIKNTKLAKDYESGKYKPLNLTKAVEISKELVLMFNQKNIEVIRIGLQNTDSIKDPSSDDSEVIAGPYHPAFGQLVESSFWYDDLSNKIKKINAKVKEVRIIVNSSDVSNVIGQKKENINKIKEIYDVDVKVVGSDKMKKGKSKLEIVKTYADYLEEEEKVCLKK